MCLVIIGVSVVVQMESRVRLAHSFHQGYCGVHLVLDESESVAVVFAVSFVMAGVGGYGLSTVPVTVTVAIAVTVPCVRSNDYRGTT